MLGLAAQPTRAQDTKAQGAKGDLDRQYDEAFQETLRQPANLDVLFKFATLASETGDLEGAISALERMLLINGNLPRVRLELGVLYFRLASYEVARTYVEQALKTPDLPPEVRAKAEQILVQITSREQRWHLAGEAFLGLRYQSNANLGPGTSVVRLFGQPANLNQSAVGAPDWGAVSTVQLRHSYDLGTQDKATLETIFTGYANRQFQLSAANVTLLDLTTGPRFQIFQDRFEDVTVKPLAAFGAIWVNDTPYYTSYGGGVEGTALLGRGLRNISTLIWRKHDAYNTNYLPTNSQFRGTEYNANTIFQYQLSPTIQIFGSGSVQRFQTEQTAWQNYTLLGIGGGMSFRFLDPVLKTGLPWTVSVSATSQWWHYDQPDPIVDPTTDRNQTDFIGNVTLAIPFDERTTVTVSGGRFVRTASLPNYAFDNNSFMFGVSWRF